MKVANSVYQKPFRETFSIFSSANFTPAALGVLDRLDERPAPN
jgi:hypothetical protein